MMTENREVPGGKSRLWSLPVFALAFVLVLVVAGWLEVVEERHEMEEFTAVVERDLKAAGDNAKIVLNTLAGYYQSDDSLEMSGLASLSQSILDQNRLLHSIHYFNWVPADEKSSFEAEMRARGFLGFRIRGSDGGSADGMPWLGRSGYLPATFMEPFTPQLATHLGTDFLQEVGDAEVLRKVVESAGPTPVTGIDGLGRPRHALIWAYATYNGFQVPATKVERREQFSGLFLVILDMEWLVAGWREHHPGYRISLEEGKVAGTPGRPILELGPVRVPVRLRHRVVLPSGDLLDIEKGIGIRELWSTGVLLLALVLGTLASVFFLLWRSQRLQSRMVQSAQRALDRERERAQKTLHAIGDTVLVVDADWRVRYVNPTGKRMLRRPLLEICGSRLEEVVTLQDVRTGARIGDVRAYFLNQSAEGERRPVRLVTSDGVATAIDSRASTLTFPDGNDGMVIVIRDVSVEHELMEKLAYQASHDLLTGLYNRGAFEAWVREALSDSEVEGVEHAMIYLDLDRFKLINDTCGHAAGDELLKQVAAQITKVLRSGDLLARVGGDEFGILLRQCSLDVAERIARRILVSIENFRFRWEEKLFQVHASIGVVPLGRGGDSLKEVLMAADLACHVAKEHGRNRIHVHALEDMSVHRHHQEMQWLPRLHEALDNDRFELFVQPIRPLDQESGLPVMNEFLIRLRNHDGRLLPPGLFIPAAERYDLMWQIDRWMVENAIGYLAETADSNGTLYTINLSAQTFSDRSFAAFVQMTLESYGVDAERICFELTETAAVTNITVAGELMQALKELGCRILLDDFGSGLSSFGYLKNLPIDYLKIDGQFVKDILTDPLDEVMVRMCQELAQVLQVKTVAEFIENAEILEAVKAIGIDYGQGYHLGRPGPARTGGDFWQALG